ncbi:MAG: phasin family protein, partial [Nevskiales bacterium]
MAIQDQITKVRSQVDDLRKTYAKAVTDANKVISKNLDKMADQQLKDIKKTYEDAIKGLQSATKKGNVKDIAQAQA